MTSQMVRAVRARLQTRHLMALYGAGLFLVAAAFGGAHLPVLTAAFVYFTSLLLLRIAQRGWSRALVLGPPEWGLLALIAAVALTREATISLSIVEAHASEIESRSD